MARTAIGFGALPGEGPRAQQWVCVSRSMPGFIMLDASESIPWSRRKSLYGPHRIGAIASMSWTQQEIRELKVNRYVLVDEEPCRILSIQMSKPGKHGEAKARLEVVGLFDGQKRSIVHPVTHKVRVPMIDKRKAQILSMRGNVVQLMDMSTYQTFELPVPEGLQGKIQ